MKTIRKIFAVILIIWGGLITLVGLIATLNDPKDIVSSIIIIIIIGLIPLMGGFLLLRKSKTKLIREDSKSKNLEDDKTISVKKLTNNKTDLGFFSSFSKYSKLLKEIESNSFNWRQLIEKQQSSPKPFKEKQLTKLGYRLYDLILNDFLNDLKISSEEINKLNEIKSFFNLQDNELIKIKNKYSMKAVEELSKLKFVDHVITEEEKNELYALAKNLDLPLSTVDSINKANAIKIFKQSLNSIKEDRRLTIDEENELNELIVKLGFKKEDLNDLISKKDKTELTYYKLLYEIENGNLPEVTSPILLQKNEICHYSINSNRLESKVVTVGYSGGSRGVSIRIMKGMSYRVGNFRGYPIKQEVTRKYPGVLTVTNKRIVFTSQEKGFTIPLTKLTNIEPYSDGIGLQKDTKYYLIQFDGQFTELIGMIITVAVNKY